MIDTPSPRIAWLEGCHIAVIRDIARVHALNRSLSGKGNCHDNAAVETYFKTINPELVRRLTWETRH